MTKTCTLAAVAVLLAITPADAKGLTPLRKAEISISAVQHQAICTAPHCEAIGFDQEEG